MHTLHTYTTVYLQYLLNFSLFYHVFRVNTHIFLHCSQMLRELIPGDLLKVQNTADWKRAIVAAYNQDAGI